MEILYFLLAKYLKKDYLILAVLLFLSYFSVSRLGTLQGFHILPWSFDQTLYYIVYFGLGHLVKNRGWISNNLKKSYTLIIFSIIYITLLVKPNLYNMTVEIMNGPLKFPPSLTGFLLTVLWAIVAISFVIYISQFLSRLFILNFLGKNSLTLLALHVCLGFNLFNIVVIENLGLKINNPNLLGVTFTLATIAFLIPVCMLINNYFPYILGRKLNFKKTIKGTHLL
jgi:fucose 4-O-acetylase-like acetyltransferase